MNIEETIAKFSKSLNTNLDEEALVFFKENLKIKKFKKGEVITDFQQVENYIYYIITGVVEYYTISDKGKKHTLNIKFKNSFTNVIESLLSRKPSENSIKALENTTCLSLEVNKYNELLNNNIQIKSVYNEIITNQYLETLDFNRDLKVLSAEERYRKLLLNNGEMVKKISQNIVASYLGIATQSLSRIKRQMINNEK